MIGQYLFNQIKFPNAQSIKCFWHPRLKEENCRREWSGAVDSRQCQCQPTLASVDNMNCRQWTYQISQGKLIFYIKFENVIYMNSQCWPNGTDFNGGGRGEFKLIMFSFNKSQKHLLSHSLSDYVSGYKCECILLWFLVCTFLCSYQHNIYVVFFGYSIWTPSAENWLPISVFPCKVFSYCIL